MRIFQNQHLRHKAAKAAFAFLFVPALTISASGQTTLPPLPDEEAAFRQLNECYRVRQAETPIMIEDFLNTFPASLYSPEATLMLADWYFYNHQYSKALQYYNELRPDTFSGDVKEGYAYRKAYAQIKTGYYKEAMRSFRKLSNSPQYGEDARFYIAYLNYVEGKYDEAYDQFVKILKSGKKGAEAEYYINQIDYNRGNDYRKVANTSERLLSAGEIPPELRAETMRVGGLSFFKLGDKVSARNILSRYADLMGDGAETAALYSLATIYYDEGDFDRALPLFSRVTEYPGDLAQSAWLYIGQIYKSRGDDQAATLAFDKAAKETWNSDVARAASYNLAVSAAEGGTLPFTDAAESMESFIEQYPDSPYASSLSNYLSNAYYARRDYENALRQIDRIPNPDGQVKATRQKILYQLGVSRLQQGKVTQAIEALKEASSPQAPDKAVAAQAALWLGDAYYVKKDYSQAAKAYTTALADGKTGTNAALAQYNLGYSYMKLREYGRAETAFSKAMSMKGLSPEQVADARLRYADCLYYNGKYDQAMKLFREIRSGGGQDAVFASIREADILGRDGKLKEKIQILEELNTAGNNGIWKSTVMSRLADAYSESGDDRNAARLYASMLEGAEEGTDNIQIYYSLASNAENLYNGGDKASALEAYKVIENSGIEELYPMAVMGIVRSSATDSEVIDYASKALSIPGLSAEENDEARLLGAVAAINAGTDREAAMETLRSIAASPDMVWAPRAAVTLGELLLKDGDTEGAEAVLLNLVDNGSDDNYWMARGYIALADVYIAQDKDYLAKLYLDALKSNYPGRERDIIDMINNRIKSLNR